jgi:hypothetical protein
MKQIDDCVVDLLQKSGFIFTDLNHLHGVMILRDILLDPEIYKNVQENIMIIKTVFSSSHHTCLQSSALEKQKWPLLNLIRQILKLYNYVLEPKRVCDGYDENKKKKYKRYFVIKSSSLDK